jgi:hypothetical protein
MKTAEMVEILEGIIQDEATNPTARCTAIRTLLRIEDVRPLGDEVDDELERILKGDGDPRRR